MPRYLIWGMCSLYFWLSWNQVLLGGQSLHPNQIIVRSYWLLTSQRLRLGPNLSQHSVSTVKLTSPTLCRANRAKSSCWEDFYRVRQVLAWFWYSHTWMFTVFLSSPVSGQLSSEEEVLWFGVDQDRPGQTMMWWTIRQRNTPSVFMLMTMMTIREIYVNT